MRRGDEPRAYAMLADQTPLRRTPKTGLRFLNRDTAFFLGPERIARFVDANVVYVAMRRLGAAITRSPRGDRPAAYGEDAGREIAEYYARHLEATIRESPQDWLWIHNKWKYPKPSEDAKRLVHRRAARVSASRTCAGRRSAL